MLCKFGCGREARFEDKCEKHSNSCPANRRKNSEAVARAHKEGRCTSGQLNRGWAKGRTKLNDERIANHSRVVPDSEIFIKDSKAHRGLIRDRLMKDPSFKHKCSHCKHTKWMGKKIPLEVHHKNGINNDNRRENLEFVCPNCHVFTDNYKK